MSEKTAVVDPETLRLFNTQLGEWFTNSKRDFPWRKQEASPYEVWVSEIMSQQTQIERVADFFWPRFMKQFPTLESLAKSNWEQVFPVWNGLGYYSRGKNALKCAQIVFQNYGGEIPKNSRDLESLPGIGKYTAAAILAFAYDQKVPAIDTNINKIISICFPEADIIETADYLVKNASSGRDWNSSMMDLASALRRGEKITGDLGNTFFSETVAKKFLPQKKNRPKVKPEGFISIETAGFKSIETENSKNTLKGDKKTSSKKESGKNPDTRKLIEVGIACIWKDGKYLIQTRPKGKSFVGFWEFPGGKREKGESFRDCVKREIEEEVGVIVSVRPHFYEETCYFSTARLRLRFHRAQIQQGTPKPLEKQELQWVSPEKFDEIKFLKTNHKALKVLQKMRM